MNVWSEYFIILRYSIQGQGYFQSWNLLFLSFKNLFIKET